MATRIIPPAPNTNGRRRKQSVIRADIDVTHGPAATYGQCPYANPPAMLCTGGSQMRALLGPDLGDGVPRGTPTNNTSLQPLMGLLRARSNKRWKAGHLLNADFGGSGTARNNLTPLTAAANNAHRVFEGHIKRMLTLCHLIDRQNNDHDHWYGVSYAVDVSTAVCYATVATVGDMHSYAYSHLSLTYGFVRLPKFPAGQPPHTAPSAPNASVPVVTAGAHIDPHLADLQAVVLPNFAPSINIANWNAMPDGITFSVDIHNEP